MQIHVRLSEGEQFNVSFGEIQNVTEYVGGKPYDGSYEIIPKVTAQEMQTKGMVMLDDVKIKSIPYYDMANVSGGNTVYIASEV